MDKSKVVHNRHTVAATSTYHRIQPNIKTTVSTVRTDTERIYVGAYAANSLQSNMPNLSSLASVSWWFLQRPHDRTTLTVVQNAVPKD